jgi:hypothetical protein
MLLRILYYINQIEQSIEGEKRIEFNLHPGDYIAVFSGPNDGTFQLYCQIEGHVIWFFRHWKWAQKLKRWDYIPLRSREEAEYFTAREPICKQCAMQRILKSAENWVSYGPFTYVLRHIILQVYWGLIFEVRVMTLVLNFRKRLLQLVLKGHLDISLRSRVMNLF